MDWQRWLAPQRLGSDGGSEQDKTRNPFERDQDRITYSTPFRRLAGKTQVFPLPESDVTHHRMTHSLEVASAGRSLGRLVAEGAKDDEGNSIARDVGAAVAAACLAHDLGNPPFGHSGEDAIAAFFQDRGPGAELLNHVPETQRTDFTLFEGNALGFRILTHTRPREFSTPGGMGLTFATLGAYLKYPSVSSPGPLRAGRTTEVGGNARASEKKFCAFETERGTLAEVAKALSLVEAPEEGRWRRHPLAFLVEAADDICNCVIDLEDAFRVGLVSYSDTERFLKELGGDRIRKERWDTLQDEQAKIGYLRAIAIGTLIDQVGGCFKANSDAIEAGTFDRPLVEDTAAYGVLDRIKAQLIHDVFQSRGVLSIEVAGFQVIEGLLQIVTDALIVKQKSVRAKKVRLLIPDHYLAEHHQPHDKPYDNLIAATEFIAGMTDSYAIDLYRMLTGIQLPTY